MPASCQNKRTLGARQSLVALLLTAFACQADAPPYVSSQISPTAASPRRVILDVDPGIDDAIAILLALRSPELTVEAVTTVAGNVTVDLGSENALRVLSLARRTDIPVAKGSARPLRKALVTATYWHGSNGLGEVELPRSVASLDRRHAVDLMIEMAHEHPRDLTVVATGPLTNVALALRKAPSIRHELSEIIVMGGSTVGGNETAAAEFNFYVDPDAAHVVFASGVPVTMVGLNATRQTLLTRQHVDTLASSTSCLGRFVAKLGNFYLKAGYDMTVGTPLHDPLALALAVDKTLAKTTVPMRIEIDTRNGLTNGASIFNSALTRPHIIREGDHLSDAGEEPVAPNADVPTVIASDRFLSLLMTRLTAAGDGC
jgi:inosine-uridine nucleoside N-ribohydrolase